MDVDLKTGVWQQFGAAIAMLDNAMRACPDELWDSSLWPIADDEPGYAQFWYRVYHTLVWLDLYLSGCDLDFTPPAPFIPDALPKKPYTKDELAGYLEHCRKKCQSTIEALTDEKARERCEVEWMELSFFELLLYNMRHVQDHAAHLNMMLGQKGIAINDWVAQADQKSAA